MQRKLSTTILSLSCALLFAWSVPVNAQQMRFTGAKSCATSGCHGGGAGKDQVRTWLKRDVHTRTRDTLAKPRSVNIAENLKIKDATVSARCTVCHAPMLSVAPELFAKNVKPQPGVSCESCHGPAERYLLSHTRPDYTRELRQAAGMRALDSFYSRANSCIACHQNLEPNLLDAGHPELFFELDRQMEAEPPHWEDKDKGAWLGPRAWLTGQAAALREIAWALTNQPNDPALQPRLDSLLWLLRKTDAGADTLPDGGAPGDVQTAADRLARSASAQAWSQSSTMTQLRQLSKLGNDFRDARPEDKTLSRRRGEVTSIAVSRLWHALMKDGQIASENLDKSVAALAALGYAQDAFDPVKFAAALEQVEVNLELLGR